MSALPGKKRFLKIPLVENSKKLNLDIKSFLKVIIFEIGSHCERDDIILTMEMLIIYRTHTITYFCIYIWDFHVMLRLVIFDQSDTYVLVGIFCDTGSW